MADELPAITGKRLARLLKDAGWQVVRNSPHGLWLSKQSNGETSFTTVKDTRERIPKGTLGQILGPKQTGLGRAGLMKLIDQD